MKKLLAVMALMLLVSCAKSHAATTAPNANDKASAAQHNLPSDDTYEPAFVTFDTRGLRCVALRDTDVLSMKYVALSCVLIDKQQTK